MPSSNDKSSIRPKLRPERGDRLPIAAIRISTDPGWNPAELPDITAVSPGDPWYDVTVQPDGTITLRLGTSQR